MAVMSPCLQFHQSPTKSFSSKSDAVLLLRSSFFGTTTSSSSLHRTRSCEFKPIQRPSSISTIRRACSANFANPSDDDFSKKINEFSSGFHISDDNFDDDIFSESQTKEEEVRDDEEKLSAESSSLMEIQNIEMKAKSLDLPLSLRMIKRKKKQLKENFVEVGETACCSVKKAFSSMVFIIRELHSYSLQMREILYYEDLQGILKRVQSEMHASFVWLFQQVFSHTPTLMVYVMILLANFTVHSMSNNVAMAALPPAATVEEREHSFSRNSDFDASSVKTFTVTSSVSSSSSSKTTSLGGNNGGGNNARIVGSGMDGDGSMNDNSGILHRPILSDGVSTVNSHDDMRQKEEQQEDELWNSIVDDASRMQSSIRDESLDSETLNKFVSPIWANIEADDYEDYFKTELNYQLGVVKDPDNVLLLTNYAQFLYLVARDYDRAEEYFKRAVKVEPKDAEAHHKYATFLWLVRNDLWAAEETFLEALSVEPGNSYYGASYASFLWNTGGEDTCYPLDSPDDDTLYA